ncbi:hypothetical protein GA0061083_2011 [Pseudarthrobacter enclensis]|uniref:Alkaline shock response membrane anchor protein AmaP n=1 Tax=Pseudarthrobacter enclensis TaxID=993070 RepID=A0A0V8IPH0_9MICC|nr:hypothetical protein [Pseudarthrobacter enclensis]KSU76635.1 hypothetical protein AS031_08445 [Pseudarthrobacter enclensis]SCC00167.1 hypothetical protein GA0061083_2011 [Pseudarthrobacter enclensis]
MGEARTRKKLIRRETHSSRAGLSIAVALVLLAVFLWLGTESVLALLGLAPLLASPWQLASATVTASGAVDRGELTAAGTAAAVLGLTLLVAALKGGRKGRRGIAADRAAVVVDDQVIAAAVSRQVQRAAKLAPEQVSTTVSRSRVQVMVTPTSGAPLDRDTVATAAATEIDACRPVRKVTTDVRIAAEGALGR